MEFTACQGELMPEAALKSFTICDAHCIVGQAYLLTSQNRSRREYLLSTDSALLILNYTNKSIVSLAGFNTI